MQIVCDRRLAIIPLVIMFRNLPLAGGSDNFAGSSFGIPGIYPSMILPFRATTYGTHLMKLRAGSAQDGVPEHRLGAGMLLCRRRLSAASNGASASGAPACVTPMIPSRTSRRKP